MTNANAARKMKYAWNQRVTMRAGRSISQKRTGAILAGLALVVGLCAPAAAQTGQVMPAPKFVAYDDNGDPCAGCKLHVYLAGTTTPTDTYTTAALSTPNANPVVLDAAGRATIFIDPTIAYKFTLKTAADVDIWTVDNVVGPFSGVLEVNAANARGLQISRSGADAGLSVCSDGGSGKCYALLSNTSGGMRLQDDSDASPRLEFLADNVNLALSGTFTVSGGLLSVTGFGTHAITAAGTGGNVLGVRNTTAGTGNFGRFQVGNDFSAQAVDITAYSSTHASAPNGVYVAGNTTASMVVGNAANGPLVLMTNNASRITISSGGATSITDLTATLQRSGTAQPGFLAYNSANDGISDTATVDFDTEVYDTASNFSGDTFTAPVTGIYHLCATVTTVYASDTAVSGRLVRIVTSNRSYNLASSSTDDTMFTVVGSGCVYADMDASDTATVLAGSVGDSLTIAGGASPYVTFFSGRLVP